MSTAERSAYERFRQDAFAGQLPTRVTDRTVRARFQFRGQTAGANGRSYLETAGVDAGADLGSLWLILMRPAWIFVWSSSSFLLLDWFSSNLIAGRLLWMQAQCHTFSGNPLP
jgi:hypothetical protein